MPREALRVVFLEQLNIKEKAQLPLLEALINLVETSGFGFLHDPSGPHNRSLSSKAAAPRQLGMDDAEVLHLIGRLAALLPEERRDAYRAKALADFEAAAGITAPDDSRPAHHVAAPTGITAGAHEMTARAKSRTKPAPTAEQAEKSSRRNARHVFTEAELRDPKAIERARDIIADATAARRAGAPVSDRQEEAVGRARALIRRLNQLNA